MFRSIAQSYRSSFTGLSRETWLLSVVILVNRCGYMAVPFMSMYLTQSLHRSLEEAGLVITLFGAGAVLGTAAGGYLSDIIGFRKVQIVTAALSGLVFILFAQITHFTTLCALSVVLGFIVEAFRPANLTAVAAYSNSENRTRSFSLNRLAINLGWGLGSSLGGILAAINYHLLFRVEGTVDILVALLIIMLLPNAAAPAKNKETHAAPAGKSPWRDGYAVRFFMLTTIYTICFILLFRLVPVYWKVQRHLGESQIGLLLGLNGIIIALFEMVLVRRWESRNTPIRYVTAGIVITGIGYACMLLPGLPAVVMAAGVVLLLTAGEMMAVPFMSTLFMNRADAGNRGQYAAAYALAWSLANITGPLGGALVAERYSYGLLWALLGLVCMACAAGFWLIVGRKDAAALA
ncbi:MFS transporter [Deminuibacter soli]|uniref:MFS transporter n=1 Tax=Deminuibacter soli TaxID=2291815 RepID=A0A3E1NI90_9BACT|nr:MFS transporter [Deminuibacter soli]RFM27639.1 MFS transporter [Deminuibacter soli]